MIFLMRCQLPRQPWLTLNRNTRRSLLQAEAKLPQEDRFNWLIYSLYTQGQLQRCQVGKDSLIGSKTVIPLTTCGFCILPGAGAYKPAAGQRQNRVLPVYPRLAFFG